MSFQDRKTAEKFYYTLQGKELPGVDGTLELAWESGAPASSTTVAKEKPVEMEDGEVDDLKGEENGQPLKLDDGHASMDYEYAEDEAWGD